MTGKDGHGRCCPLVAQPLHDTTAQRGTGGHAGWHGMLILHKTDSATRVDGAPGWHGQATPCNLPQVPHQWVYARMLRGATSAWSSHAQVWLGTRGA